MKAAVVLVAVLVGVVLADLPIHCLVDTTYGEWEVSVAAPSGDKTIDCAKFTPTKTMKLTFAKPNVVTDEAGNKGTWTMMDDEGIEFWIDGQNYYTWFWYNPAPYKCDVTSNGWYHPNPSVGNDWGCWSMKKVKSIPSMPLQEPKSTVGTVFDEQTATEICNYVNSKQKSWVCDPRASRFTGKSVAQLQSMAGRPTHRAARAVHYEMPKDVPDTWDWRNVKGVSYVSPVRDQAFCGSCYSFAATGAFEARIRVASNNTLQPILAPQDVVSCDKKYSQGCSGGFDYIVGKYFEDFGVVEESCFKYTASDSTSCSKKCTNPPKIWKVKQHKYVGNFNGNCSVAEMMQQIYAHGPISVAIEWAGDMFFYKSGVYTPVEGGPLARLNWEKTNHAVVVVGWGKSGSKKYWIVKNSWGSSWGDHGYFNVDVGVDKMAIESSGVYYNLPDL